jgi:hypothetical protein
METIYYLIIFSFTWIYLGLIKVSIYENKVRIFFQIFMTSSPKIQTYIIQYLLLVRNKIKKDGVQNILMKRF